MFLGYGVVTSLLLASIFYWNVFPVCFVEGVGLTAFKKIRFNRNNYADVAVAEVIPGMVRTNGKILIDGKAPTALSR